MSLWQSNRTSNMLYQSPGWSHNAGGLAGFGGLAAMQASAGSLTQISLGSSAVVASASKKPLETVREKLQTQTNAWLEGVSIDCVDH